MHVVVTERSLPIAVTVGLGDDHEGRKLNLTKSIGIEKRMKPEAIFVNAKYHRTYRFHLKESIKGRVGSKPTKNHTVGMRSAERLNGWIKAFRRVRMRV